MNKAKNNFIIAHVAATVTQFQDGSLKANPDKSSGNPVIDCINNAKDIANTMEEQGLEFKDKDMDKENKETPNLN